jgi:hypothetical protein
MTGEWSDGPPPSGEAALSIADMQALMQDHFGFRPFAALGSNLDPDDLRWLSYMIGRSTLPDGTASFHAFKASRSEPLFLRLHRRLFGRYPFYLPHRPTLFLFQTLVNALSGGDRAGALPFLGTSLRPGANAHAVRILFQNPATLTDNGQILHCRTCPDAVTRDGHLIPACISDRWEACSTACLSPPGSSNDRQATAR